MHPRYEMEAFSRHAVGELVSGLAGGVGAVGSNSIDGTTDDTRLSIRARQRQSLEEMLTHGSRSAVDDDEGASADEWKVLVYDDVGRDIIAPLLRVADLRKLGVTLHLSLATQRQRIPDVAAVYFIAPTEANVARIIRDVSSAIYESFSLNFTSRLPRGLLETLAEGVSACQQRISRVYDMYNDFSALESDLFALNIPRVYQRLNAKNATSIDVDSTIERVVDGLFCAVATLGVVPVIRAQRNGPAEMVAKALDARIRETLVSRTNIFNEASSRYNAMAGPISRPLLIIVDRTLDVPVMLHHTWTYQAIAHDTLGLKLNRVKVAVKDPSGQTRLRSFDLDKTDEFWKHNSGLVFPMVAEAVEKALQNYQAEVAKMNVAGDANGMPMLDEQGESDTAKKLAAAIQNIPELRKRKQIIDLHTNIATAMLEEIKERGLDGFYQIEEELLQRPSTFNVQQVLAVIQKDKGTAEDKMRVFLIYYLCVENPGNDALQRCLAALKEAGITDFRAYEFVKGIKAFTQSMASMPAAPAHQPNTFGAVGTSVLGTLSQVADGVNKLILSEDKAQATARVVNTLMDQRGDADVLDQYLVLDPKGNNTKKSFREALVFVVGPGNYVEYQNCRDHVCAILKSETGGEKRFVRNGKTLIYGATELLSGTEFLEQLSQLTGPKIITGNTAAGNGINGGQ